MAEAWGQLLGHGAAVHTSPVHAQSASRSHTPPPPITQVVLSEEGAAPRRRTRVIPMLAERTKWWAMREARGHTA